MSAPHFRYSLNALRRLESELLTQQSRFAIPFVFRGKGHYKTMNCMQNPYEIERLYDLVRRSEPRRIVEIGTAKGGALYLWTQAATPDATLVSVDLPDGEFGGGYRSCRVRFYQSFRRPGQKLVLLRADSHAVSTVSRVREALADKPVDFLFIDGDHTFEGVKQDFDYYGPLVRPGGLIAFHDILPRLDVPEIQVHKFWGSIRGTFETEELVGTEGSGRRIGCGVLRVPQEGLGGGR